MVQRIHLAFIGFIVAVSFVAFNSLNTRAARPVHLIETPSMIPGAEAVRPLAANQSFRVNEIASELTSPAPSSVEETPDADTVTTTQP